MKIESKKLEELRDYLLTTSGSPEIVKIAEIIGVEPEEENILDAYQEALMARYPEEFDPSYDSGKEGQAVSESSSETTPAVEESKKNPEPEQKVRVVEKTTLPSSIKLVNGQGILIDLEVVRSSSDLLVLRTLSHDYVKIIFRGKEELVDVNALKRRDPDEIVPDFEVTVEQLVALAEAARA